MNFTLFAFWHLMIWGLLAVAIYYFGSFQGTKLFYNPERQRVTGGLMLLGMVLLTAGIQAEQAFLETVSWFSAGTVIPSGFFVVTQGLVGLLLGSGGLFWLNTAARDTAQLIAKKEALKVKNASDTEKEVAALAAISDVAVLLEDRRLKELGELGVL